MTAEQMSNMSNTEKKLDVMFFTEEIGNSVAYVNMQRNFTKDVIAALKK